MSRLELPNNLNSSMITMLVQILDKVRTLCKEYRLETMPAKVSSVELTNLLFVNSSINMSNGGNSENGSIGDFLGALDQLRGKIFQFQELEEQYKKLQSVLQKNETQIRKHIGIQQQFKLYIDTIKNQYQEAENQKEEVIESSKLMIKHLKQENEKLNQKLKILGQNSGAVSRGQQLFKKQGRLNRHKQRVKSQYCSSLHIRQNRHQTENSFVSPVKQRLRQQDFRIQLTQRLQHSKKKKVNEFKKKQNYTVMAYMGHNKKRDSKDKGNFKKALISYPNKKKLNFGSEMKSRQQMDNRVYNSIHSLESIDYTRQT